MSQTGQTEVLHEPSQQMAQTPKTSVVGQVIDAFTNLILPTYRELVTILRIPTPVKVSKIYQADTNGLIGGGIDSPNPEEIYRCPVSGEAWLHRITVWSPEHEPVSPLNQGQILCTGTTAGEIIFYLPMEPDQTQIAPMQPVIEGRTSAPHLNPGEVMQIVGGGLPAGVHIRIDIQLNLVTGVSEFTPRVTSPTNLDAPPVSNDLS